MNYVIYDPLPEDARSGRIVYSGSCQAGVFDQWAVKVKPLMMIEGLDRDRSHGVVDGRIVRLKKEIK